MPPFYPPLPSAIRHWLHVQSVSVHLGRSKNALRSRCLTSLRKKFRSDTKAGVMKRCRSCSQMHGEPSLHGRPPARSSGSSEASQPSSRTPTRGKKNTSALRPRLPRTLETDAANWKLRLLWRRKKEKKSVVSK